MTRLKEHDVDKIPITLKDYNAELHKKTGCSLEEIAARAVRKNVSLKNDDPLKVAVVPMTCGQGIIEGFAESVASIVEFLGFDAIITQVKDAGGVAEAVERGAKILFMADDDRFVAINLCNGSVSDNGDATGKGYVTALEQMCKGLENKNVLLIGAGAVGKSSALALAKYGANVSVYDLKLLASQELAVMMEKKGYTVKIETNLEQSLQEHRILVDASPAKGIIMNKYITGDTMIAAPGIPLGVEDKGLEKLSERMIHDPLQLGVATMIFDVL